MINKKRGIVLIFLLVFFLSLSFVVALDGCYYYPGASSSLYCKKVAEDKASADYSGYLSYFSKGQDCSKIKTCQIITCNVNCQTMTQGECQTAAQKVEKGKETGWEAVTDATYNDWCSEGCCQVAGTCYYQQSGGTKWTCNNIAQRNGLTSPSSWITKITDSAMNPTKCQQTCGAKIVAVSLKGSILDKDKKPISQAKVEIQSKTQTTGSAGTYSFQFNPGVYLVKVSRTGYSSISQTLTLKVNQTNEFNFTLSKAVGTGKLTGLVKDTSSKAISRAAIYYKGPTTGSALTDAKGAFSISGLVPKKQYTFTISKYGYTSKEQTLTLATTAEKKDFVLTPAKLQGLKGYVWLDKDGDGKKDEKVYGASIYVGGVFRGYSQYSNPGYYEISLSKGSYQLAASYSDFELKNKINITLAAGETKTQDLVLTKYLGECSYGGKNATKSVSKFSANPVIGEKKVLLKWSKPCPEVSYYQVTKYKDSKPVKKWTASPATFSYLDSEVSWANKYTYEITAVYTDVKTRFSKPVKASITLGDKECEGKYSAKTGWATFCSVAVKERKTVWTCNNQNKKVKSKSCSSLDTKSSIYYCAEIGQTSATCKDAGKCSILSQAADPFGLYYDRQTCYGVKSDKISSGDPTNFCYFDYTKSVVDQCNSCANIKSCFDYQGKDACEINNCLGSDCNWVPSSKGLNIYKGYENILLYPVQEETGQGYCTQKDYEKDDKCNLCGPKSPPSTLFENYYCTSDVCSELGRCFSHYDLSECKSCGKAPDTTHNCYSYSTKQECVGTQSLVNKFGEITPSKDQCGWGKCVWKGLANKFDAHGCVKDGDGDGKEDCASFSAGEKTLCMIDNQAPQTKLVPEGKVKIISFVSNNLTFQGVDNQSRMGILGYCLASAKANTPKCTSFKEIKYPGKLSAETLRVDLINGALKGKTIKGETYRLRYYSKDRYFNQEDVAEAFIFVDTEKPQFEIKTIKQTKIDKSNLTVYLTGLNEPMDCSFKLGALLPKGTGLTKTSGVKEKDKRTSFSGLKGIIYNLTVSCVDGYGNKEIKVKNLVFDLEQAIDIVYPQAAITKTTISFQIKTATAASCGLYNLKNQKLADFAPDKTNLGHKTKPLSGFKQGNYSGNYKAVCRDLLTQKVKEDYFDFQIDFTPPKTQVILTEGKREIKLTQTNWQESFVKSATVSSLRCSAQGFSCNKTYYCLGSGCEYRGAKGYKEFSKSFGVNKTTSLCYYSADSGGNQETPSCGKILVEGFGITLVSPAEHFYRGEKWGISNKPNFDWKITTKVPTTGCQFDFKSNFVYGKLESYKTLKKEKTGRGYYFDDGSKKKFPGGVISAYSTKGGVKTVYVKCQDLSGQVGPTQKINLEYDPTAPTISKAYAKPDKILEGTTTALYVDTDDKTLCRYDEGKSEYATMRYSFPGEKNKTLAFGHQTQFALNFKGAKKTYKLVTQCKNGAGVLSKTKNITFTVDYSTKGNIISTKPAGYISGQNVNLEVVTNKKAQCKYNRTSFKTTGAKDHKQPLGTLKEGKYVYLISCLISGEKKEGKIEFMVDRTPPKITRVDDGKYSCSLKSTPSIFVYTNQGNVSGYYYELYEVSPKTSYNTSKKIISKGNLAATSPFKLTANLKENYTYSLKIRAGDAAKNWGALKESDGFVAVSSKYSECTKDTKAPVVSFVTNESCSATLAEMKCSDTTNCQTFNYYQSFVSGSCKPSLSYTGQKVSFKKTGWLCYYVDDPKKNNRTEIKKIEFKDADGDGVSDTCDKCASTPSGKYVDSKGCAYSQTSSTSKSKDTDGDGLPDSWEKLYHDAKAGCYLDYTKKDSNQDGTSDDKEDYDKDSYSNYQEYSSYYDPCYSDAPQIKTGTTTNKTTTTPTPSVTTTTSTVTKQTSIWAWIFLLLGLLLVLGGSGYLIYFYKFHPAASKLAVARAVPQPTPGLAARPQLGAAPSTPSWKQRIFGLKKASAEKEKTRQRKELFGIFSTKSKKIPHLEPLLKKNIPHPEKVHQIAKKYVQKKEVIKPGLRPGEKGVFAQLENIANRSPDGKKPVVAKKEAKNIFDQLKKISEKRKK